MRKRLKKSAKRVKDLVPDNVSELNPLAKKQEEESNLENVPRITNETIAVHREQVLKGARKYIYPLQHSKHRIIVLTSVILSVTIIGFMAYSAVALYKLNQYNAFLYRVTQVIPFPVARAGSNFISYENYLFDLRRYVHYAETQQSQNITTVSDKQNLVAQARKQSLDDVTNKAYIKILAHQNKVGVSDKEVNERIVELKDQNRLGSNDKVFADVLRDYWGWSISDFKRSLKDQILSEKVVAKLDTDASKKANAALAQIKGGADFATTAAAVSEDPAAKTTSGDYGFSISKVNPNVPPQVVDVLFKLKPGQISDIINAGTTLEIVKLDQSTGNSVTAHHISFKLKNASEFTKDLKKQKPVHNYIKF
jgi:parvulin-like peptidyl-prolyl isomerase